MAGLRLVSLGSILLRLGRSVALDLLHLVRQVGDSLLSLKHLLSVALLISLPKGLLGCGHFGLDAVASLIQQDLLAT